MRSGIILAGGRSSRFGGGEKALRAVGGRPMICSVRQALRGVVDEIIVSVRDEEQRDRVFPYLSEDRNVFAYDERPGEGPLAGILAALKAARGGYVAIVACDMPFISARALELLFERAAGHDAAVPAGPEGFLEPLHAVYRREAMIGAAEQSLRAGESRLSAPLKQLRDVVYVPLEDFRRVDPGLETFRNINRAEDLPP